MNENLFRKGTTKQQQRKHIGFHKATRWHGNNSLIPIEEISKTVTEIEHH